MEKHRGHPTFTEVVKFGTSHFHGDGLKSPLKHAIADFTWLHKWKNIVGIPLSGRWSENAD